LRSFRNDRELSLETTADAAGVHPNYLGEVERGKRNISLFNIWRWRPRSTYRHQRC
jgi:transcriptional regulator with XRE-family HTH domain